MSMRCEGGHEEPQEAGFREEAESSDTTDTPLLRLDRWVLRRGFRLLSMKAELKEVAGGHCE